MAECAEGRWPGVGGGAGGGKLGENTGGGRGGDLEYLNNCM
jgi:hypothetical protein